MYRDQPCSGKAAMMHDEVVSRLRRLLIEGEIPPGARIPERELCASLSISRTPLREALKVLPPEGLGAWDGGGAKEGKGRVESGHGGTVSGAGSGVVLSLQPADP